MQSWSNIRCLRRLCAERLAPMSRTAPQVSIPSEPGYSLPRSTDGPMQPAKIWTRLGQRVTSALKYRQARRYRRLLSEVEQRAPLSIVEVGVYEGVRATEMIERAALSHEVGRIRYFGFDLFDLFTPDVLESELS